MASLDDQKTWVSYPDAKDCSQGFCSLYCPQWCYMIFPPPPPLEFPREGTGAHFSPLVIAIISILASSFLLISYYIIASKYCRNPDLSRRRSQHDSDEELNDSRNPSRHENWQVSASGLDEAVIKSITVCKYKRGDGLVEGTDCSVCLTEFQENESLRLLPKCSHAFHLPCIDMWLKSHSNCPLCRAGVISTTASPPQLPPPIMQAVPDHASSGENRHESDTALAVVDLEMGENELNPASGSLVYKAPAEAIRDVDGCHERNTVFNIRDEEIRPIRRTFSMDSYQDRVSIADVLTTSMGEDLHLNNCGNRHFPMDVGSSKQCGENSKNNNRSRALHSVMNPTAMKRSSSSGRLLIRHGKGVNSAFLI